MSGVAREQSPAPSVLTMAGLLAGAKLGHLDEPTVRPFLGPAISRPFPLDELAAERAAELRAAHRALRKSPEQPSQAARHEDPGAGVWAADDPRDGVCEHTG